MAIRRTLASIAREIGELDGAPDADGRSRMERVRGGLVSCLRPHLAWEERTIHPIVDKYACEGPAAFSSSMRYEHEIIYRWLGELEGLTGGDIAAFRRRADNLLGLVEAHFELEERVLFPILDRSVSPAAFGAHVGDAEGP
jgi:iron-sulfur cluster repair protein YtfE (RIC family)